jgi:tRNA dimethylallyltransferase
MLCLPHSIYELLVPCFLLTLPAATKSALMNGIIAITGPTASGKTKLASALADIIGAEIISADSRQVYRGMDIGTGKDIDDYTVNGRAVPFHLVDVADAGDKYNVFRFQQDFIKAYKLITEKGKPVILCGGSGMYLEAALNGYRLTSVPPDEDFRQSCQARSHDELVAELETYKKLHNNTDTGSRTRLIRAIEIERHTRLHGADNEPYPQFSSTIIGVNISREERRSKITARLEQRLAAGMVGEVQELIDSGVDPQTLIYYGLEYKFITEHLLGVTSYGEMRSGLEIAIHQFAKRQMTWFRGMERRGAVINWIDGGLALGEKIGKCAELAGIKIN